LRSRPQPRGSLLTRFNRLVIGSAVPTIRPSAGAGPQRCSCRVTQPSPLSLRHAPCCWRIAFRSNCIAHLCRGLGSKAANNRDKVLKGRQPRGESHALAKLTQNQADLIRSVYGSGGGTTMHELAVQFGVSRALVSLIIRNKILDQRISAHLQCTGSSPRSRLT
jgi:hypothetical protein